MEMKSVESVFLLLMFLTYTSGNCMNGSLVVPNMCSDSMWSSDISETGKVTIAMHNAITDNGCRFDFKHNNSEMKTLEINLENTRRADCLYSKLQVFPERFQSRLQPQPLKSLECYARGTLVIELPTSGFTLTFVGSKVFDGWFEDENTTDICNYITFTLRPCVSCRKLEESPKMDSYMVNLPKICGTRSCLNRDSRKYILSMDSFDKFEIMFKSYTVCRAHFKLQDPPSICIRLSTSKTISISAFRCDDVYAMLYLDSDKYMTLTCETDVDTWCLPDEWIRGKSDLQIDFQGLTTELFYKIKLEIQTNTSRKWANDCPAFYPKYTPTTVRTDDSYLPTSDQTSNTDNVVMGPVVGIISFSAFVIGVCCFAAYVRSKSSERHQRRGRLTQHAAYFTTVRNVQSATTSFNVDFGPFPAGQHPSISNRPSENNPRPPEMDLPPPYPGKSAPEAPPPSYEDACNIISTENVPGDDK